MLKELYIENLAVIEKATIDFSDRLNVFTGETGAGKSIMINGPPYFWMAATAFTILSAPTCFGFGS